MDVSFAEAATALRGMANWERSRIELCKWFAMRGQCEPPSTDAFGGWQARLRGIEAAAAMLDALVPHEAEVRGRWPELGPVPVETAEPER